MSTQNTRNKNAALNVESTILKRISEIGVTHVAESVGVHKSQVTRWKESIIPRAAALLVAIGLTVMTADHEAFTHRVQVEGKEKSELITRKEKTPGVQDRGF